MGQFFHFLNAGPGPLSTMYQQYPTIALGPSDSCANSLGRFRHPGLWRCLLWPPTPFQAEVWKWIQPAPRPYREGAKVSAELGVRRTDWGSWPAGKLWKSWLSGVVYGGFMGFPKSFLGSPAVTMVVAILSHGWRLDDLIWGTPTTWESFKW